MRDKLVLGLSGGVDSAVAARRLREEYDVTCLWLDIGLGGGEDAAAVAAELGLPFETADIRDALEQQVCGPFAADYLAGRTPLPCARCNPTVKFPALLALADRIGAPYVATGHYARRGVGPDGRALLLKGRPANDQSYMLARLPQEILRRTVFPLGDLEKSEVRALAKSWGIPVAEKPDSMEICFIPDGDYAAWLDKRGGTPPPGDFVDREGNVMGRHKGIHHYTLGQRRGLGVSGPHRYFVSAIRPETNQVVLSDGTDLHADRACCTDLNWIALPGLTAPRRCTVRLRHSKNETEAVLHPTEQGVEIQMLTPARAPTPGQLAVFYDGDSVLGSGWIC
ncbi:tRNA 2-thiouridine(34) synthase MnmA [Flavonifractor sp. An92]|uniref:tRNA 2-thiouridine(34) synthase MnmA n=1 Tax=Flavonifractor sp. An92 TaxID=1965666 RepID=UPI000B38AE35|nr:MULTISPECIES: tRNA 2-thiouridine(34) synthase MnmA [unclassified Flavonifractor]OUN05797.1 tRNA 2-thiouridine(34) synthase MnmA [Flavonifractor sp. An92]OUQ22286.1 tRNA 2-thiouridine(34) synthase MnmA [Flavonifractor sp. An135]